MAIDLDDNTQYAGLAAEASALRKRVTELEARLAEEAQRGLKNGQARIAAEAQVAALQAEVEAARKQIRQVLTPYWFDQAKKLAAELERKDKPDEPMC